MLTRGVDAVQDVNSFKPLEWQNFFHEAAVKFDNQVEENKKLTDDLMRRQDRYIKREQEYRRHIDELQRELRIRCGFESNAAEKNTKIIKALHSQLMENIDEIQPKTKQLKEDQEKDIVRKFSSEMNKIKKKIEERKTSKGDKAADMKDRQNELNHHLDLITNIAQRIDNENRALMKKNSELKSEYKSQENDRELLLKQLVTLKKENAKYKEETDYYLKVIEEKEDETSQVEDLGLDDVGPYLDVNSQRGKSREGGKRTGTRGSSRGGAQLETGSKTVGGGADSAYPFIGVRQAETEEQKTKRYERVIEKLRKMLENERKQLKGARLQYQREVAQKTELEHLLR